MADGPTHELSVTENGTIFASREEVKGLEERKVSSKPHHSSLNKNLTHWYVERLNRGSSVSASL